MFIPRPRLRDRRLSNRHIMLSSKFAAIALVLPATAIMAQSTPVVHCVSTKDELLAALQAVQAPGQTADQEVRLHTGTYDFHDAEGISVSIDSSGGPIQFTLEGGFDPVDGNCLAKPRLGAQYTTIANYRAIAVSNAGNVIIRDLSLTVPAASGNPTAYIQSGSLANIERVIVRGGLANDADHLVAMGKDVLITNTLISTAGTTIGCSLRAGHFPDASHSSGNIVVHHSTIAAAIQTRGICLQNSDALAAVQARVSNSIALTSAGYDIENAVLGPTPAELQSNLYHRLHQFVGTVLAPQVSDTIDAGFEVFADVAQDDLSPSFSLTDNPAIGTADPNVLPALNVDVYGTPRHPARPDRGAIENDRIFAAAFE